MAQKKQPFKWEAGKQLPRDAYEPVKEVRDVGFEKIADGIYADPVLRKEQRKKKLTKPIRVQESGFFVEESESGLHQDIERSDAAKVIRKETKRMKGINQFGESSIKKKVPKE